LLTAVLPTLNFASRQSLLVLLKSLAWLHHVPGPKCWIDAWWQAYAAHLQPKLQAVMGQAGRAAARPTAALTAGTATGAGTVSSFLQQQQRHQGRYESRIRRQDNQLPSTAPLLQFCAAAEETCQQLTVVLSCFLQLAVQPSGSTGWVQTLTAVTQPLLHQLSEQRFSLLLVQVQQSGLWPGEAWLSAAEAVLLQHEGHMPPRRVLQTAGSLRRMGWKASPPVKKLLRQSMRMIKQSERRACAP
jgi:hypothetical protein